MAEKFPYNGDPRLPQAGESFEAWYARREAELAAEDAKNRQALEEGMAAFSAWLDEDPSDVESPPDNQARFKHAPTGWPAVAPEGTSPPEQLPTQHGA